MSSVIRGKSSKCATSVTKRSFLESMATEPATTEDSNGGISRNGCPINVSIGMGEERFES